MLSSDRDEFSAQLRKLCAGFNVPYTEERLDAYWSGLAKMSLPAFARMVDDALGEEGSPKIPTTNQLWKAYRDSRARLTAPAQTDKPQAEPDHLAYFANRLLFKHILGRVGLKSTSTFRPGFGLTDCSASPELRRCQIFKNELVAEFTEYVREGDDLATPQEFIRRWILGLGKVSEIYPVTLEAYQRDMESPGAEVPFARIMARHLESDHAQMQRELV